MQKYKDVNSVRMVSCQTKVVLSVKDDDLDKKEKEVGGVFYSCTKGAINKMLK